VTQAWPDWQVAAEVEIRSLVQRYNACGDVGRFDEFLDLFATDAVYVVTGREAPFEGHDGIRRLLDEAGRDLRAWAGDRRIYIRHFTSTHQIDFDGSTEASGRVYYQCLMPHGLDHWGRYTDRYRVIDGRWRFASRTEKRDGMVADGWCDWLWGPNGTRVQSEQAATGGRI
jgi:SnoaL-like protein